MFSSTSPPSLLLLLLPLLVAAGLPVIRAAAGQGISFPNSTPLRRFSQCADHGKPGVCLLLYECPQARKAYATPHARRPTKCGFEGNTLVVCCTSRVPDLREPDSTTQTNLPFVDISPPDVSFRCGVRPRLTATSETTYHLDGSRSNTAFGADGQARFTALPLRMGRADGNSDIEEPLHAVHGFLPERNTWPWVALLGWRQSDGSVDWRCDGSLITPRFVLTAAHCLDRGAPQLVRLGEHDYNNDTDGAPHEDYDMLAYYLYPEYSPPAAYHDLALLELGRAVQLREDKPEIVPICLPWGQESTANLVGRVLSFVGWGVTQFGSRELSPVPQEIAIDVYESSVCHTNYSVLPQFPRNFPRGITTQDFVCAGDLVGGMDACQGDSGGPSTYKAAGIGYVQAGIVSKGYGCGSPNFPGLYTPILKGDYLQWIKSIAFSPLQLLP